MTDSDLDRRIRDHAHRLWLEEGRPEGRAEAHWEMARELVAIEDNQRAATKRNPAATQGRNLRGTEPVEPIEAVENQGEFPTLTDQGEKQPYPKRRQRTRKR